MRTITAARWAALADALVLGPYLAYSSRAEKNKYFRAGLLLIGLGTAVFGVYRFFNQDGESEPEATAGVGSLGLGHCGCEAPRLGALPFLKMRR